MAWIVLGPKGNLKGTRSFLKTTIGFETEVLIGGKMVANNALSLVVLHSIGSLAKRISSVVPQVLHCSVTVILPPTSIGPW